MNIPLNNTDGIVSEDGGKRGEVDTSLSHSGGKSMAKIVKHEMKGALIFCLPAGAVVGTVHSSEVCSRISVGRKYPNRGILPSSRQYR